MVNKENVMINTKESVTLILNNLEVLKKEKDLNLEPLKLKIKKINDEYFIKENQQRIALQKIEEQYQDLAEELAIENDACPCSRWGSPLSPNEVEITLDGVKLTWIKYNDYGSDNYDCYTASWDDLIALENKTEEVCDE